MNLAECRKRFPEPLTQATLVFLVRRGEDGEVSQALMAMKKVRFGAGRWNGTGGKQEPQDASIKATAVREAGEEIFVIIDPANLVGMATLRFYFPHRPGWGQQVHVYLVEEWEGEPTEGEEMRPQWFEIGEIPYDDMWPSDRHWLPLVLGGSNVLADFVFGEGDVVLNYEVNESQI